SRRDIQDVLKQRVQRLRRDGVFDCAFGGVGDEEVVVVEGVVVTCSSLEMLTNSCLGGIMVNFIFLEGFEEEAFMEFMGVFRLNGDSEPSGAAVSINGLDAGNPLHVQNSDYTNSVIIPFKLLGTENYRIWFDAVKLALQARNKYVFVDGTCLKESYASSDVLSAQWDRCNAIVLTWIMNVGGSSVADYYHRLNSLWREFNALTKLPKCTCEVKCSCDASKELGLHQQLMKLMQFLMGLDDCY
ncbi:ribonuclease H-like domain-containing protein, partial [Tanacetum coccineum]